MTIKRGLSKQGIRGSENEPLVIHYLDKGLGPKAIKRHLFRNHGIKFSAAVITRYRDEYYLDTKKANEVAEQLKKKDVTEVILSGGKIKIENPIAVHEGKIFMEQIRQRMQAIEAEQKRSDRLDSRLESLTNSYYSQLIELFKYIERFIYKYDLKGYVDNICLEVAQYAVNHLLVEVPEEKREECLNNFRLAVMTKMKEHYDKILHLPRPM